MSYIVVHTLLHLVSMLSHNAILKIHNFAVLTFVSVSDMSVGGPTKSFNLEYKFSFML